VVFVLPATAVFIPAPFAIETVFVVLSLASENIPVPVLQVKSALFIVIVDAELAAKANAAADADPIFVALAVVALMLAVPTTVIPFVQALSRLLIVLISLLTN